MQPQDQEKLASRAETEYVLDAEDRVVSVGGAWSRFAAAKRCTEIQEFGLVV